MSFIERTQSAMASSGVRPLDAAESVVIVTSSDHRRLDFSTLGEAVVITWRSTGGPPR
jgi:hypothetical protein